MAVQLASRKEVQLELQWNLDLMPTPAQREAAFRYLTNRRASGMKEGTLPSVCNSLSQLARHLGDLPFEAATNDHLILFLGKRTFQHTRRRFLKDGTERHYDFTRKNTDTTIWLRTGILRTFYNFLVSPEKAAVVFEGLRVGTRPRVKVQREDLIAWEEVLAMMQKIERPRDRALLALLCESGMRTGEVCALNISSIQLKPDGTALAIIPPEATSLKSGARDVRLYHCVPYLKRWLAVHPFKDSPDMPLFGQLEQPDQRMKKGNLYSQFQRWKTNAEILRHMWPHLTRHTGATELASNGNMGERLLRERHGWAPNSQMPAAYVHLAGDDVNAAMRRVWGLDESPTQRRGLLDPLICPICNAPNLQSASFCCMCSKPFSRTDQEAAQQRLAKKAAKIEGFLEFLLERSQALRAQAQPSPTAPPASDQEGAAHA